MNIEWRSPFQKAAKEVYVLRIFWNNGIIFSFSRVQFISVRQAGLITDFRGMRWTTKNLILLKSIFCVWPALEEKIWLFDASIREENEPYNDLQSCFIISVSLNWPSWPFNLFIYLNRAQSYIYATLI